MLHGSRIIKEEEFTKREKSIRFIPQVLPKVIKNLREIQGQKRG